MRDPDLQYSKLVLVCTNNREDGRGCCMQKGSDELYYAIKTGVAAKDPTIRVSRTGCLGNCLSGSIVVIMPDNIWLGDVGIDDVPAVIEKILNG